MTFEQFRNDMKTAYTKKFDKSFCDVTIYNCLGKSLVVTCHLASDNSECVSNIVQNDMIQVMLSIDLPRDWKDGDELPDNMTMKAIKRNIKTKSAEAYLYCDYRPISFRKVTGGAEKMIASFEKFVDRLYKAVMEEYEKDNLMDFDRDLVQQKYKGAA